MIDQSITLCGNLTKDIEFFDGNTPRAKFRIAHNSRWLDSTSGEWKENETLFMDVICWRTMAQNVCDTIGRGDPVVVVGRLRASSWTDAERAVHTRQEIEADVVAVDLRRGVTGRYRKVARNGNEASGNAGDGRADDSGASASERSAGESAAFQTESRPGFGEPGFNEPGFGEPGFNEPGFAEPGLDAASAQERELVGAGTEPPF